VATHPSYPDGMPGPDLPGAGELVGGGDEGAKALRTQRAQGRGAPRPRAALENDPRFLNTPPRDASNREERRREADEDRELILLAQKGDHAAFRRLVERHQRRAFSVAVGLVRDENDARELVQEAFLRVYRGIGAFRGGSSFYTWLYRIITNLAIDAMRAASTHRREVELHEDHTAADDAGHLPLVSRIDGGDPLDVIRRRELAVRIQAAIDELPPYHRSVILMREVEGMSYEEMAHATGVSEGTVMSRLFHARKKMQLALADCYAEEDARRAAPLDDDEIPDPPEEVA
jgi:RNA polymerase sigma-70 factor (ECF subfamily)